MPHDPPLARRAVVVFAAHALPHVGGVELYVDGLLRRLASRGWSVHLVTSDVGGACPDEMRDGVRVLRVPAAAMMAGRLPVPYPTTALVRAFSLLREARPAIAVTNTRFQPISWLGAAFATRMRIPLLHIEHGSGHVPMIGRVRSAVSRGIDRTMGRWVVRHATQCVGVSPASAAFLESLGAHGVGVLPSGVDGMVRSDATRRATRQELGLADGDVAVLFLGRVTEDKGVPLLLDAFRTLPATARPHLLIAGEGDALGLVRGEAAKAPNVHVLGPIRPADVPALLISSDVFVHPSLCAEGGPRTVLEAAAAGLPIVATPQGITGEIVRSEAEGILVPIGDVVALGSALRRLVADPALRAAIGDAARRNVTDRFDWERIAAEAERLLLDLAAPYNGLGSRGPGEHECR